MCHPYGLRIVCYTGWLLMLLGWQMLQGQLPDVISPEGRSEARWLAKPVRQAQLLDDMESQQLWVHLGQGELLWTQTRFVDGRQSLRLRAPARPKTIPVPHSSAPFGQASVRRLFSEQEGDWRAYNRLGLRVYPHLSGLSTMRLMLRLRNQGTDEEAIHWVELRPEEWNQVLWEIPHLARDRIEVLDIVYHQRGDEPGATSVVVFDIDHLELQSVEADPFEGWTVWPERLAHSHVGYRADSWKVILASGLTSAQFKLLRLGDRTERVFPIQPQNTPLGSFQLLDFSQVRMPGQYKVQVGASVVGPFAVGEGIWHETTGRVLDGFLAQRCGTEVPGVHPRCHLDWNITHGGETRMVHGGWHPTDGGLRNLQTTAEAVHAMMRLAVRYEHTDAIVAHRLIEEASWGLDWLLNTRFADGTRVERPGLQIWSDNRLGTADDPPALLTRKPVDSYLAASAAAVAARVLIERDAPRAKVSLEIAKLDWATGQSSPWAGELEVAAAGTQASLELFRATGEQIYANAAVELANEIVKCQQRTWPDWAEPLTGFFYTSTNRHEDVDASAARALASGAAVALAGLCQTFPNHERWIEWYSASALYSEFLRKAAELSGPWLLLPTSLHAVQGDSNETGVRLNERLYMRRFPPDGAGHLPGLLAEAKALSSSAHSRRDLSLLRLAERQMQWVVGRNPFSQSLLAGVGQDCPPFHSELLGDITGTLPTGFVSRPGSDAPYWPTSTAPPGKQATLLAGARWLSLVSDLDGEATVTGQLDMDVAKPWEFTEVATGLRYPIPQPNQGNRFSLRLPAGRYQFGPLGGELFWTFLPGRVTEVDLVEPLAFLLSTAVEQGTFQVIVRASGRGTHRFHIRTHNLRVTEPEKEIPFGMLGVRWVKWPVQVEAPNEPWLAVVIPNRDVTRRREVYGSNRLAPNPPR